MKSIFYDGSDYFKHRSIGSETIILSIPNIISLIPNNK